MGIRNVVFDLGGVMINYNPRQFIDAMGYDPETSKLLCEAIFLDPVWVEMDMGKYMTYQEALPNFIARHPSLEKEIRTFFSPGWMDVYTLREETERRLYDWVYERGANIYILSNYAADGFEYISRKFPFFSKAKGWVVSAYEKCMKPDPRIYGILLERYGLKAEESVFIDDMKVNVEGAVSVGMEGIVYTGDEHARKALLDLGI